MEWTEPLPLPSVADGVEHPLDPRSISVHRIGGWIFFGTLLLLSFVGAIVGAFVSPGPFWVRLMLPLVAWTVLAVGLGWLAHHWPVVDHRHSSYRVDHEGIEIRRGVFWRHAIDVPRNRVQHTDVSQGPVERSFGLGTLVIFTAGTEHARVTLGGLDHEVALRIRDHLLATERGDAV
jgi:membrane protein YdbS with pleckstrin-like domain